jgi:hypothetical protein
MNLDSDTISECVRNRELVRIERFGTETLALYLFPLGLSKMILAALYVADFHIDGLIINAH